jgi:hypothetical protein
VRRAAHSRRASGDLQPDQGLARPAWPAAHPATRSASRDGNPHSASHEKETKVRWLSGWLHRSDADSPKGVFEAPAILRTRTPAAPPVTPRRSPAVWARLTGDARTRAWGSALGSMTAEAPEPEICMRTLPSSAVQKTLSRSRSMGDRKDSNCGYASRPLRAGAFPKAGFQLETEASCSANGSLRFCSRQLQQGSQGCPNGEVHPSAPTTLGGEFAPGTDLGCPRRRRTGEPAFRLRGFLEMRSQSTRWAPCGCQQSRHGRPTLVPTTFDAAMS